MTNNLEPYSKICVPCAKALGGRPVRGELWFNQLKCEICNKETGCISAKDYKLGGNYDK